MKKKRKEIEGSKGVPEESKKMLCETIVGLSATHFYVIIFYICCQF